jgi:hypothetical protein
MRAPVLRLAAGWSLLAAVAAQQPVRPLRSMMPDDVILVVETDDAGAAAGRLLDALGAVPKELPETVRTEIAVALTGARLWLGEAPSELGRQLAGGGAAIGIAPRSGGNPETRTPWCAVLRPGDRAAAEKFLARFGDRVVFAFADDLLLLAGSPALRDRLLAQAHAGAGRWAQWPEGEAPKAPLRALVDLAALRAALALPAEPLAKLDGGGRWLFAPLLPALLHAERLVAELDGGPPLRLSLRATLPADGAAKDGAHDPAMPWRDLLPKLHGERAILAPPEGTLAVLALDRGVRALLAQPARFLRPAEAANALAFLSVADRLVGARTSFVGDLLPGLGEPWTLYVLRGAEPDDGSNDGALPELLLPSFAVATTATAAVEPILMRAAQALLLIANTERAQRRQLPYVLRAVRDDGDGVHGLLAALPDWHGAGRPPTAQAVAPSLLFGHGHAVLATSPDAARALLAQAAAGRTTNVRGDAVQLFGAPTAQAIDRDQAPLVLARMLDEGETEAAATRFFQVLAGLLTALDRVELRACAAGGTTALELELWRRP